MGLSFFYASGRAGATSAFGSVVGSASGLAGASAGACSCSSVACVCSSVSVSVPREPVFLRDVPGLPVRGLPDRFFVVSAAVVCPEVAGFLPCCSVAGEGVLARGFLRRLN